MEAQVFLTQLQEQLLITLEEEVVEQMLTRLLVTVQVELVVVELVDMVQELTRV
jgi:hypothetical protein